MDAKKLPPAETVSASKKLSRKDAEEIAKGASRVIVAKGKQVEEFETGGKAPKAVIEAMLGPTGNLRAPLVRAGKTVLVGFNDEAWTKNLA
ncbi:MAG TPA: ArsC family (seleno)protein [Myxococcota bacterium]|jgi:arsenate reductase-like glutaredoxin family protein